MAAGAFLLMPKREKPSGPGSSVNAAAGQEESANARSRPSRDTSDGDEPDTDAAPLRDPVGAVADAMAHLKDPELALELADLLGRWAKTDPEAALAWVEGSGRSDAEDLRAHVIFTWAEKSPDAAAIWLEENPGMQQPSNLLALLGPWLDASPEAAVAWSTTKIEVIQREGILADLLVACRTEANALALLGEVDPVVADNALQAAVTSLADEEPDFAKTLSALITGPVESTGEKPPLENTAPAVGNGSTELQPQEGKGTAGPEAN